jgi:hypothetical protein
MASDERDPYSIFHFAQGNPQGSHQGDVPALLRRVADSIEALGAVKVQDITFHTELDRDAAEWSPSLIVYYHRDGA